MINSNIIFWERDAFKIIQSLMLTKYGTKNKMQTHRCTDASMHVCVDRTGHGKPKSKFLALMPYLDLTQD